MQNEFDKLYQDSLEGKEFTDIMSLILKEENILLAYRNIKANEGSKTAGTDGLNIEDIAKLSATEVVDKVRYFVLGSPHGYRPKPVRRKEIPKADGKTRPLGIPCIWDRLIQQCIKQILEPICEAKFSDNSYGFRPQRSVENAIARTYRLMQMQNLHHVVEFDIEGFFDNVNHSKLIKQIWALNIHDKKLIWIIKRILKAPIKLEDGSIINPDKGTPQGGIISPLLANIVLNELDKWIESQWQNNAVVNKYKAKPKNNGSFDHAYAYKRMKDTTNLKEMWIVRYADDFRIFCRKAEDAVKVKIAVSEWIEKRLKLKVSNEKTRIVDARHGSLEFLGFEIRLKRVKNRTNGEIKYVINSHISKKALERMTQKLVLQVKKVCSNPGLEKEVQEIVLYNSMVIGMQNYYRIATNVASDLNNLQQQTYRILYNRLNTQTGNRLTRKGRKLRPEEEKRYGKSKSLRFIKGTNEPIYPIGYVQFKNPMAYSKLDNIYTEEGRKRIHDRLKINAKMMKQLKEQKLFDNSIEYYDNRISLFSAQYGKCYILGTEFTEIGKIHCHHKIPKFLGGDDNYNNLVLIDEDVHKLIHAKSEETVQKYITLLKLNAEQLQKINKLRRLANNKEIK